MEQSPFLQNSSKERYKIELEVISPIHVGAREGKLTALEFIAEGGRVYVIDEDKLGRFLLEKNLIDHFVQEVRRGPVRMASFLKEKGRMVFPADLPKITTYSTSGGEQTMQEFRPFVRDGGGTIFLPGASLKGVFRTAVLYIMAKKDRELKNRIISKVQGDDPGAIRKNRKFYSEGLLQKGHMQGFKLPNAKDGPNQDILRCLIVRDAYPVRQLKSHVMRIHFLSKSGKSGFYWSKEKRAVGHELSVWLEAVVSGTFATEILWDSLLFEEFKRNNDIKRIPVKSLSDVMAAVKEMALDLAAEEEKSLQTGVPKTQSLNQLREYLKGDGPAPSAGDGNKAASCLRRWYELNRGDLFRIGFGSGMLSTSVGLILPPELRKKIRDACGSEPRPDDPAPKSRRVWRKSETEILPMGWMRVRSVS